MPAASRDAGRRGLVAALVLLVVILLTIDLLRPDSLVLDLWGAISGSEDPYRGFFRSLRERGPGRIFRR